MAITNNIGCYKGEAVVQPFLMTPLTDITGWTIQFTLKRNQTDPVAIKSAAVTGRNDVAGTFNVSLAKADTNIPAGTYYYDIQRTDAGSEAVLSIGTFTITQEVLN